MFFLVKNESYLPFFSFNQKQPSRNILRKGILKMYSIFTGEHTCQNVISKNVISRSVLKKLCSENMQQMYRKTPMPKCDFTPHYGMGVLL